MNRLSLALLAAWLAVPVPGRNAPLPDLPEEEEAEIQPAANEPPPPRTASPQVQKLLSGRLDTALAPGSRHTNVRIPVYQRMKTEFDESSGPDSTGAAVPLASLLISDLLTRPDLNHLQFERAVLRQFKNPETPERPTEVVHLRRAIFNLQTDILTTSDPVRIRSGTQVVEAGAMLRDNRTDLTCFTGGVQVTFYESEEDAATAIGETPVPSSAPATDPDKK